MAGTHSKSGMVAYQGGICTVGVGIVIVLLCVTNITSFISKQYSLDCSNFEKWILKGHQRDANLHGACARPKDERSLVRGGGGVQPRLF